MFDKGTCPFVLRHFLDGGGSAYCCERHIGALAGGWVVLSMAQVAVMRHAPSRSAPQCWRRRASAGGMGARISPPLSASSAPTQPSRAQVAVRCAMRQQGRLLRQSAPQCWRRRAGAGGGPGAQGAVVVRTSHMAIFDSESSDGSERSRCAQSDESRTRQPRRKCRTFAFT